MYMRYVCVCIECSGHSSVGERRYDDDDDETRSHVHLPGCVWLCGQDEMHII